MILALDDMEKTESTMATATMETVTATIVDDEEKQYHGPIDEMPFLAEHDHDDDPPVAPPKNTYGGFTRRFWFSAGLNTISTAAIIFINKRIFETPSLRHAQVTFAAFHFTLTFLILYALSTPRIALFTRAPVPLTAILPLASAMILNVVLPNASLAYSSIQFYQIVRVLVTPCVAALNWILLKDRIPRLAVAALIPLCLGVAVVTYFDTAGASAGAQRSTTGLGVFFAFTGLGASAVYTVWVRKYQRSLGLGDQQLLLNQAPVSVLLMLYDIPFSDDVTVWGEVGSSVWVMIFLSGVLATLINVTQFAIISEAGPVSSSVVGQFKTCCIFALGWIYSAKPLKDWSLLGVGLAMAGIIWYTYAIQKART